MNNKKLLKEIEKLEIFKKAKEEIANFSDLLEACLNNEDAKPEIDIDEELDMDFDFIYIQGPDGKFEKYSSWDEYFDSVDTEKGKLPTIDFGEANLDGINPVEKEDIAKHYDFSHHITDRDLKNGFIKVDPYFVADIWNLGSRDPSGALFHILKTIARFGLKTGNTDERELKALVATVVRLCEINNVNIQDLL